MLKCDSTSAINKLWKTLNYFRQLISAYKMAAHNYFAVCVCHCMPLCVCVSEGLRCWFTVAHFLSGPPSRPAVAPGPAPSTSATAVAVKQFVSLMHFAAAKSSDCQVRPDVLVDLLLDPPDPSSKRPTTRTRHKMAQRKRFSMKFMTHGNIRRSLTFTSPRRCLLLLL